MYALKRVQTTQREEYITSDCQYITSDCQYITSDCQYITSDCQYITSDCQYITSDCQYITSDCQYITSDCQYITSDYQYITSDCQYITSDWISRVLSYLAGWLVVKVAHSFTTLSGVLSVMSCHWYVGAWDIDFLLSRGSQLSRRREGWISKVSPPGL